MSRRVLLVDSDVDALGELASALRAHGVAVTNANDAYDAVEQAFKRRPDVVLAAKSLDEQGALTNAFSIVPELADTPFLFLVDGAGELGPDDVPRGDLERIISRIADVTPRASKGPSAQETRGDLQQVPLIDLLQLLSMNRRSGVLGITTPTGAGEVRLAAGEVIDAVYRRLEGEKALFRLLGEREGHFAFSPGEPVSGRRILTATAPLLIEAMRQVDEVRRRRAELAPAGEAFLMDEPQAEERWGGEVASTAMSADAPTRRGDRAPPHSADGRVDSRPSSFPTTRPASSAGPTPAPPTVPDTGEGAAAAGRPSSVPPTLRAADPELMARWRFGSTPPAASQEERAEVAVQVTALLQMPHHLDELLDEINAPDLTILEVLKEMFSAGKVRRVSLADLTTPFAPPEQLPVLRSLVTRLARPGFLPPPCLVIAAGARRMSTLAYAVRRIADALVPAEPPPRASLPRPLGVLRLGDGVELSLMGLPDDDMFSPMWPLALHGAAAVVRLSDAGGEALASHCAALEILLLDAESLMGSFDVSAPGHVAALVRSALETAAGV